LITIAIFQAPVITIMTSTLISRSHCMFILVLLFSMAAASSVTAQETVHFSTDQVEAGQAIYRETCQICHGNRLSNGQFGTPLRGSFFRNNWKGKTLGELLQHTWEKMPPDNVQSLSREQVASVIAFIFQEITWKPVKYP